VIDRAQTPFSRAVSINDEFENETEAALLFEVSMKKSALTRGENLVVGETRAGTFAGTNQDDAFLVLTYWRLAKNPHSTHQPRVKIVFSVLTCTIARGPSHAARAFAEDRHAVTSRRTCS
jgi:hypothetical protein